MHIHPTPAAGQAFLTSDTQGPIVMLNLLRFRDLADYSECPTLKPDQDIRGKKAYRIYMKLATPLIEKAGSRVLFSGRSNSFLIGPPEEQWDFMLLVEHKSKEDFLAFASDQEYLKIAGHRTAALADSRLLPIQAMK